MALFVSSAVLLSGMEIDGWSSLKPLWIQRVLAVEALCGNTKGEGLTP